MQGQPEERSRSSSLPRALDCSPSTSSDPARIQDRDKILLTLEVALPCPWPCYVALGGYGVAMLMQTEEGRGSRHLPDSALASSLSLSHTLSGLLSLVCRVGQIRCRCSQVARARLGRDATVLPNAGLVRPVCKPSQQPWLILP
jgi:hypothetical protein